MKTIWTREASRNLNDIISYLDEEWSEEVSNNFLLKLKKRIDLLSNFPESFPLIGKEGVRASVLIEQITIFYSFDRENSQIIVLSIFDTRQNPDNRVP
jgi:plasmid stabilization system protein ParE